MLTKWKNINPPHTLSTITIILSLIVFVSSQQYCNQTQTGTTICYPCYYRCKQCSGTTLNDCISCTKQYLLVNNTCKSCGDNCFSCKTIYDTTYLSQQNIQQQCETCIQGYYLYQSTGKCIKCPVGAETCTLSAIQSCSDGYYLLNGICIQCQPNCISCSDSVTCTNCNEGYYLNQFNTCNKCPISHCLSCQSLTTCDRCEQGYSGNNCEFVCEDKCGMCYSGVCFFCKQGFYMLNGSCQPSKVLCGIGVSYNQCSQCVGDISSLGGNNICVPFYTVHDQNRLIFMTALNNYQSFSSIITQNSTSNNITQTKQLQSCPSISTYIMTFSTKYVSITTSIQPSYKISLIAQIFVTSLSFSINIYANSMLVNSSLVNVITGDLPYLCGNDSFYIINVNSTFSLNNNFNSSNTNLTITFNLQPININTTNLVIGLSQMYLQLHRCRVTNCLYCKSPYTCQTCIYPYKLQNNQCVKSCSQGYYLTQTDNKITCTLECNKGFYPVRQDYTCQQCIYPCIQCQNQTTCYKCHNLNANNTTNNETYFLYNSQCVSQCPNRYFADTQTYQCQQCVFPCQQCIAFDKCKTCKIGYLNSVQYSCVAQCPQGQYSDFLQLKCLPCQSPCSLCQYSASACLQCSQPYYFYPKNNSCLSQCPQGYAMISTNIVNECKQCEFPCKSCMNSQTNCSSCLKGYLYNNKCLSQCLGGYYKSTNIDLNNICLPCENNCAQCVDKEICLSCISGYRFNTVDSSCVSECPRSTYQQIIILDQNNTLLNSSSVKYVCQQCIPPCYDCTNSTYCLSCTGLLFLNHLGQCLLQCPLGTYIFYNSTLQQRQCMLCEQNCIDCVSQSSCNECKDGWLLFEGICYVKCPSGTFANQKGYKYCEYCQYPCMQCVNEYQCVSCVQGFVLEVDNMRCVEYCSVDGYYQTQVNVNPITNVTVNNSNKNNINMSYMSVCLRCSEQCQRCIYTSSNCLSCAFGYYYNNQTKSCSKQCPSGTYYSQAQRACSPCQYPCKTCVSYFSCLTCYQSNEINNNNLSSSTLQPILYLYRCIEQCPLGYYTTIDSQNITTCQKCQFPCQQCFISSTNCTKCKLPSITYYNYSSVMQQNLLQCVIYCPQRYYQQNYICKQCQQPCYQCYSDSYCTKCIDKWYLLQGECYQGYCPYHYYKAFINQSGYCMLCDNKCRQCFGLSSNCSSCVNNYYLIKTQYNSTYFQYSCTNQCPVTYYASSSTMQCVKCQIPCLQCYSKSYCKTCVSGYLMQINKCVTSCSQTFYLDIMNSTYCTKCLQPCQKCTNSSKCLSCIPGYFYLSDNYSCIRQCPSRMYGYKVQVYTESLQNNFKGLCLICSQLCQQCSSFSVCTSCNITSERKYLQSGRCQSSCSEGFYPLTNLSLFYPYICKQCQDNCVSCTSYDICTKCVSSYLFQNKCVNECPNLYYGSSSLKCQQCLSPCRQCYNQYNCKNCIQGYYLYNKICVKHCPQSLWSDYQLRECVQYCGVNKFKNIQNKSCIIQCDRFYSPSSQCVDQCWGLDNKQYVINSSRGCQLCQSQQQQCRRIYEELTYSLEYMVWNGRLMLVVKFNKGVKVNQDYQVNSQLDGVNNSSNFDINSNGLVSFIQFSLKQKDKIQQQLDMQFIQLTTYSNNQNNYTVTQSQSVDYTSQKLYQSQNSIVSVNQQFQKASLQPNYENDPYLYQHVFSGVQYSSQSTFSHISTTTTTNINNTNHNIQQSSLNQYIFSPNILWLQLQSLPSQQQQSFTGYLICQIQHHLQLISQSTYYLSSQSQQQQHLPLQSIHSQSIQIKSFSPNRKLPQWFNQLMKTMSNLFSYLILILIVINVVVDNVKSQFHFIDTAQNMYLLLWVIGQLQFGITPFLQGFNISAFIISSQPTYGTEEYTQFIKTIDTQQLLNCTPKQLIYGNACQFTQYFLTLLPFIAVFISIITITKAIIYFKPFIQTNLKIHHKIIYNHINNFYWLFITGILFIASSQLIHESKKQNIPIINLILIIFAFLLTVILGYEILKNIFNCSFEQKTFFWGLKCHKIQNQQGNIHFLLVMLRKSIILIAAVIGTTSSSNKQLVFIFLLVFVSIIILSNILANSPFKKRLYQYIIVVCQLLLIGLYVMIEIYIVAVKNFDMVVYVVYNVAMFIVAMLVIGGHVIIGIVETYKHFRKKYQQYNKVIQQSNIDHDSRSSSCDTQSNNVSNKKISKHKQTLNKQNQIEKEKENSQFVLLPASLQKFKLQSTQTLKIKQPHQLQPKSNQNTQNQQQQTKHQKLNNSEDSHYQSSSGFQFHSAQNSQQFQQPAKYLIKLEKNVGDSQENQKS